MCWFWRFGYRAVPGAGRGDERAVTARRVQQWPLPRPVLLLIIAVLAASFPPGTI